jgi:hypothetical protein
LNSKEKISFRGYTTTEDGGQSYDMLFTGINVNRKWKDDRTWFGQYAGAYVQSTLGGFTRQSHARARAQQIQVDSSGTEFKNAFSQVTNEASV